MYTYKAQKEKTMELSKKRRGRATSTAGSHAAALASGRRHRLRTPSQQSRGDLLFRGSCKRTVPQKKNPKLSQTGSFVEITRWVGEERRPQDARVAGHRASRCPWQALPLFCGLGPLKWSLADVYPVSMGRGQLSWAVWMKGGIH